MIKSTLSKALQHRWQGPGGCGQVLRIALPLVISTAAHTIQLFVDSVFLMSSSRDEMAAAASAGIVNFTISSLFFGTITYVDTFVAQYSGAARPGRVGPAVWQGIYFAIIAGVLTLCFIPAANSIFTWAGHGTTIRAHEIVYFRILCIGAAPMLIGMALSSFFTGRCETVTIMIVRLTATVVNIVLDYCLIFGKFGFPRWGIAGAAWATVISAVFSATAFFVLFLKGRYRAQYATLTGFRPDREILRRLLRYGFPNGVHFMLSMSAFSLFVMFVGRIDSAAFAATVMTFRINGLAFLPMIGIGIAISTLTGQALGRDCPQLAQRTTWSGFYVTVCYTAIMGLGYWLWPQLFLTPFALKADPLEFAQIAPLTKNLLCFVAFYCVFDASNIVFSATLRGAGDTRFVMVVGLALSWLVMAGPAYLTVHYGWGPYNGLYVAWFFPTTCCCTMAVVFLLRFLRGKWKTMRVIEGAPAAVPAHLPEVPVPEIER